MARPKKYPDELINRGVRLALESGRPIAQVAADLGMGAETLRRHVRQAQADNGERPDLPTSAEREEIRKLREENYELRRANEILKAASVFSVRRDKPAWRRRWKSSLEDALVALRLDEHPAGIERVLETMEDDGLVFSTPSLSTSVPQPQTFHIALAGTQWLCDATGELRRTEGFLGAFVARCGEHLV